MAAYSNGLGAKQEPNKPKMRWKGRTHKAAARLPKRLVRAYILKRDDTVPSSRAVSRSALSLARSSRTQNQSSPIRAYRIQPLHASESFDSHIQSHSLSTPTHFPASFRARAASASLSGLPHRAGGGSVMPNSAFSSSVFCPHRSSQ